MISIKKNRIAGLIILILFFQLLFITFNQKSTIAEMQNDNDLETILNCQLESNSSEILSSLMPSGTYSFQSPLLDSGSFSHEITSITVSDIQYPSFNLTDYTHNSTVGSGNYTVNSTSGLNEYSVSKDFDTIIRCNINYSRAFNQDNLTSNTQTYGESFYNINETENDDGNYYQIDSGNMDNKDYGDIITSYSVLSYGSYSLGSISDTYYNDSNYLQFCATGSSYKAVEIRIDFDIPTFYECYFFIETESLVDNAQYYGISYDWNLYSYGLEGYGDSPDFYGQKITIANKKMRIFIADYSSPWMTGVNFFWIRIIPTEQQLINSELNIPYENKTSINNVYNGSLVYEIGNTYDNSMLLQYYDNSWINLYDLTSTSKTQLDFSINSQNNPQFRVLYALNNSETPFYKNFTLKIYKFNITSNWYPFENLFVDKFIYQILGINYEYTSEICFEISNSSSIYSGNLTYYFSSQSFPNYNNSYDLTILTQNISYIFNISFYQEINFSYYISFSANTWKVPTEINLEVNNQEVVDQSYNSGFVSLSSFPTTLSITASQYVFFSLNITIDFTFEINLEIISKTYLHKTFSLSTDHLIIIESIDFNDNLNLKKVYLNSIEYPKTDPSPIGITMNTGNIYYLDVLLSESIYQRLNQVIDHLGSGNYQTYISGTTNTLIYNDYSRFSDFSFNLPDDFSMNNMNLTFSDMQYTPYYTSNESNNIHNFGYENQSYTNEQVNYASWYYYTQKTGNYNSEYNTGYNYSQWIECFNYDDFQSWMHHYYYPSDESFNGSSYEFGSIDMQNRFPNDFYNESYENWNSNYDSDYTSLNNLSSSNLNFSSNLNEGNGDWQPEQANFNIVNGSIESTGDLETLDYDYYNISDNGALGDGHYLGTYSFEGDGDGTNPDDWTIGYYWGGGAGCTCTVISDFDGHNKVVDIYDNGAASDIYMRDNSMSQTSGTVEFWIQKDTNSDGNYFYLSDGAPGVDDCCVAWTNAGQVHYRDGTGWHVLEAYSASEWYHVRIEFDCADDWHLWINEVSKDGGTGYSWWGAPVAIDNIEITSHKTDTAYHSYIDAIGYDWDPDYNVGDNLNNPEPELEFTITGQLTQSNDTIDYLGVNYAFNTTSYQDVDFSIYNFVSSSYDLIDSSERYHSMSLESFNRYANYSIQSLNYLNSTNHVIFKFYAHNTSTNFNILLNVFDVDFNFTKTSGSISAEINKTINYSFLDLYDSDADYQKLYNITYQYQYKFTNTTYYDYYMSNNNSYFATYMFESELGLSEEDISFITSNDGDADCEVSVIKEKADHNYILDFYDNNGAGQGIWSNTFSDKTTGEISFYVYFEHTDKQTIIGLLDDGNYGAKLEFKSDGKLYFDGASDVELIDYSANRWYKIKLVFSTNSDTYDIFIDGELTYNDADFDSASNDGIDQFYIESDASEFNYHFYLDAIDYSWDSAYQTWKTFEHTFIYDSDGFNSFSLDFNFSNGLFEIQNFNYTIWFICEGNSIDLYQLLTIDLNESVISDYHSGIGLFSINMNYVFTNTTDPFISNYSNSVDSSQLRIQYNLYGLNGNWYQYNYTTNSSETTELTFNATYHLETDHSTTLKNFTIDIYLLGNSTEITLYNISLWDHDISFDAVNEVSITDSYVCSNQEIGVYFNATDPHISHFTLNQTYLGNTTTIYTASISNNIRNYWSFSNSSTGNYSLDFIFYDLCSNYELWTINYTVICKTSISVGYNNPIFPNQERQIAVHAFATYNITATYYSNHTNYVQYSYSSTTELVFNFSVQFNQSQYYNISVLCITEFNDIYYVNISGLFVAKRSVVVDFIYYTHELYQDENFIAEINLREVVGNQLLDLKQLNYTITAPNSTVLYNTFDYTNSSGNIAINISTNLGWVSGFYQFNCSFTNVSSEYLYYWKMWSFEILPIERAISNSSDVNLTVNSNNVINNTIQINSTSSISISSLDNLTFDLSIAIYIEYNESFSYSEYLSYTFTFSASTDLTRITIINANLTSVPSNFTQYYYNSISSTNYTLSGTNLQINNPIGRTYYNDNTFTVSLRYYENSIRRVQLTTTPRTDANSVEFREYYIANTSFSYWYFVNSLEINDISLYHNRTGTTIEYSDFSIDGSLYYFEESSLANDQFTATVDYLPGWDVSYSVITDNGTYASVQVNYKSDIEITGVTIVLDFSAYNLYAENWTYSATQSSTTKIIEIPSINFTTTTQILIIEGVSSIPYMTWSSYESNNLDTRIAMNNDVDFAFYMNYTKYTEIFDFLKNENWTAYNCYYGSNNYSIQTLSDTIVRVTGTGFDPSVNNSYIHISTRPFQLVNWDYTNDTITITIVATLNIINAYFEYAFDPPGAHDLICNNDSVESLSDASGNLYFTMDLVPAGTTIIVIEVNFATPLEVFLQFLFPCIGIVALIITYYYFKRNENAREKVKGWLSRNVYDKLKKRKEEKGFGKLIISQNKEGKFLVEGEK